MKLLLLLRHAEAVPAEDDLSRVLTAKGRVQAERVAARLAGIGPGLALHSPATRIRQTLAAIVTASPGLETRALPQIYNAAPGTLYEAIRTEGGAHSSLLLIGHNPGIYALAAFLAGEAAPEAFEGMQRGFAPATLAVFEWPVDAWSDLMPRDNLLTDFIAP